MGKNVRKLPFVLDTPNNMHPEHLTPAFKTYNLYNSALCFMFQSTRNMLNDK